MVNDLQTFEIRITYNFWPGGNSVKEFLFPFCTEVYTKMKEFATRGGKQLFYLKVNFFFQKGHGAKFAVGINENQDKLPTLYWLPKLHKRPYKARFIANSSSCTTTILSKLLTSCLTAVKKHWIRYYDTVYASDGINYFWSIKNSNDVINKFKSKNFKASKLSTYNFSTLYTTLPLIKGKLTDLINRTFIRENIQYLACNEECAFFTSDVYKNYNLWSCQKVCDALVYLLDNIFITFGTKLYRQTIGIPMGTNCAPLAADLFHFCYERDFMKSFSRENQADII